MLEPVILINIVFAATAVLYGLCSRNAATAAVAGIFVALIHAALLALVAAQSGAVTELPYLKDAVDAVMQTGYVVFAYGREAVYLAAAGLVLLIGMIGLYLVKWALASLVGLAVPAKA